jgi:hypothetical protein
VINGSSSGGPCGAGAGHCREVPDVSAAADPYTGYEIYYNGSWGGIGGTSAAAPLWAAFMALVDASSGCAGTPVGFANPALYSAAASGYATSFGDVVAGNNDYTGTNSGAFAAGTGYDMASGLGSPIGSALPAALCSHSGSGGSSITLTNPGSQTTTVGVTASVQVQATDSASGAALSYSASGLPAGLAIDPASGLISGVPTRAGSSTATVTASDTGGAARSVSFAWTVATRTTSTSVACSPSTLTVGATTTCTATVSDTGAGGVSSPSGAVTIASNVYGQFPGGAWCALAQASPGTATCSVSYAPASSGLQWISGAYAGDAQHGSSSASASLGVTVATISPPIQATPSRPPATAAPAPARAPGLRAGDALACPPVGGKPSFWWTRDGAPISGATSARYVVAPIDEGTTLRCAATVAGAAAAGHPSASSASFSVPVPVIAGCPAATGRVAGAAFGLVRLGMSRQQARRAYARSRDSAGRGRDAFCLTPIGIRVGYGRGRTPHVVWIATGSAFYAVDGIRAGSAVPRGLKLGRGFAFGRNRWYLVRAGAATILVEVRGGVVQQIGIAVRQLTRTRAAQRALVRSL